jgi:hypothetical protein
MKITKKQIDNIFEFADDQSIAWLMLYELVYPNWNEINKLDGYPQVNEFTNEYIMSKFIELDKKYHPDVISGGLWLNLGFSSLNTHTLPDWEIVPCEYSLKDN